MHTSTPNAAPAPDPRWAFWTTEVNAAQAKHRRRFEALFAGDPAVRTAAVCGPMFGRSHGLRGNNDIDMLTQPEEWIADCLADMAERASELADRRTYAPAHFELDAWGTHFVDALFAADVGFHEGQVWSRELACDVGELQTPDLTRATVLRAALATATKAVEAGQGRVFVTTPVLSCPINIAVNLFGQRLLVALLVAPRQARRALRIITDVIVECIRQFRAAVPPELLRTTVASSRYMPAGYGFVDGCATQLVSAEVYREFFAPLDAEILSQWPHGGMIHLCGACAQHIPTWREMDELRAVQLNDRAADDLELYAAGLRADQVLYVTPRASRPARRVLALPASGEQQDRPRDGQSEADLIRRLLITYRTPAKTRPATKRAPAPTPKPHARRICPATFRSAHVTSSSSDPRPMVTNLRWR